MSTPLSESESTDWRDSSFGQRLHAARKSGGITQEVLAEKVCQALASMGEDRSTSREQVSHWERDKVVPEGRVMQVLPVVLGVDGHWLLLGQGDPHRKPGAELRLEEIRRVLAATVEELEFRRSLEGRADVPEEERTIDRLQEREEGNGEDPGTEDWRRAEGGPGGE